MDVEKLIVKAKVFDRKRDTYKNMPESQRHVVEGDYKKAMKELEEELALLIDERFYVLFPEMQVNDLKTPHSGDIDIPEPIETETEPEETPTETEKTEPPKPDTKTKTTKIKPTDLI